jgi:pimeloyl-ACP methyl ester carboxylesterase
MTRHLAPVAGDFEGCAGNRLAADIFGDAGSPVLFLHGGGQTRHAWRATAERLARRGHVAVALDQRGHGESDWIADAHYAVADFAADATRVCDVLAARHGRRPVLVGASLGGLAAMVAAREASRAGRALPFSGVVLVDITPRIDPTGVDKITGFMRTHAADGFATIEQAAEAVAAYLPHRPRPKSLDGLKKNLRRMPDGRWRWHWDPKFLDGPRPVGTAGGDMVAVLSQGVRAFDGPVLLVRGGGSELVTMEHVAEFRALCPQADFVDVAEARHMVAGDKNDVFAQAILDFLAGPQFDN